MSQAVAAGVDPFLALLALLSVLFLVFRHIKTFRPPLPPGPTPWPLIGNAFQMGKKPHVSLANFAKTYGPIMSLRLGVEHLIFGSSVAAATEILKTHDRKLSGRHIPHALRYSDDPNNKSIGFTPECHDGWKSLRTLCRMELFSAKALEAQTCVREKKAMEMVEFIRAMEGKLVNISEVVLRRCSIASVTSSCRQTS